ncbi:MAG: HD domain-containing protein [Planctomycetota bacterium]
MSQPRLNDIRRGDTVEGIYLVEGANFKQGRNGKYFIQMTLRDASAAVRGLRWEASQEDFAKLEKNPFLSLQGRVEEFQGNRQIIVDGFEPLSGEDARIDPKDFLPHTKYDIDEMLDELRQIVADVPNPGVRDLVHAVLARPEVAKGLPATPAGKSMHHAYVGGLLEHVVSLCRLALQIADHYPWIDRSVLIAGVVLHDLGKVSELSHTTGFNYTDEGQLLGHIVIALGWIDEAARNVPELPAETLLEIKHIVASHHGKLEFGSPKTPMTAEAIALHFIDNLDAKLAAFHQSFQDAPLAGADRWSEYSHMFSSRLYFPRRMDDGPTQQHNEGVTEGQGELPL